LQVGKLGLEFLVHRDMHIAIEFDEQGKQHQSALDALDQRKLRRAGLHDPANGRAAVSAISIP
jgi:hypothetical protein